jgi:hypothetical protein
MTTADLRVDPTDTGPMHGNDEGGSPRADRPKRRQFSAEYKLEIALLELLSESADAEPPSSRVTDEAFAELAPLTSTNRACVLLGRSRATHYRRQQPARPKQPRRRDRPRRASCPTPNGSGSSTSETCCHTSAKWRTCAGACTPARLAFYSASEIAPLV